MHKNIDYLQVHNLSFERTGRELIRQLSFSLNTGAILQITGANGMGKTSLLRILAGFIPLTSGDIYWSGNSIKTHSDYREKIAYLGHQSGITLGLTPYENLALIAALYNDSPLQKFNDKSQINYQMHLPNIANKNNSKNKNINHLLQQFDLIYAAHVPAYKLSAGQQRRIALASLILRDAKVWILDEPFTALDRSGILLVEQLLSQHLKAGGIAIIATHQTIKLNHLPIYHLELLG